MELTDTDYERMAQEAQEEREMEILVSSIADKLTRNGGKLFAEAWDNEHRTHHQIFMRWIVAFIRHNAAKNEGQFDLRNAATISLCKKIAEAVELPEGLPYI
jgi:hypothetical protein